MIYLGRCTRLRLCVGAHLKANPFPWGEVVEHKLMSSLPLEEQASCGAVRETRLVIPHQVPTHKVTVVPRMQCSVEQERVIFRAEIKTESQLGHVYSVTSQLSGNNRRLKRMCCSIPNYTLSQILQLALPLEQT